MKRKFYVPCLFLIVTMLIACSGSKTTIKTDSADQTNLQELKQFGIARINADNPDVERELTALVRAQLEAKGLKYVNHDPDFLVAVSFYDGIYKEYIPPTTVFMRDFNPDYSGRRERDLTSSGVRRTKADAMASDISKKRHTFEGYVDEDYYQNVQVYFVQALNDYSYKVLWRGEADNRANKKKEIVAVAPELIANLMAEFPQTH